MTKKILNEKEQAFKDKITQHKIVDLEAQEKYKAELEEKDRIAKEEVIIAREKAFQSRKEIDKGIVDFWSKTKDRDEIVDQFFEHRIKYMSDDYRKDIGL